MPYAQRIESADAYYYGIKKIVTVILLHRIVLLAKCTPYQHLDCSISYYRHLPDVLRSSKQLRLIFKYLAQGCDSHVSTRTSGLELKV